MKRLGFSAFIFLSLAAMAAEEIAAPAPAQAAALLQDIEARFSGLASLRYQVECTTRNGRQSQTEQWAFAYQAPDRIRIDYHEPLARTILIDPVSGHLTLLALLRDMTVHKQAERALTRAAEQDATASA